MKAKITESINSLTTQTKALGLLFFVLALGGTVTVALVKYFVWLWAILG